MKSVIKFDSCLNYFATIMIHSSQELDYLSFSYILWLIPGTMLVRPLMKGSFQISNWPAQKNLNLKNSR